MTEAERTAFLRGYSYGVEAAIEAHDDLLRLATRYLTFLRAREAASREWAGAVDIEDEKIRETMAAVRRVRFDGPEAAALMFEFELIVQGVA